MANAYFEVPIATNEPVLSYAPGSMERENAAEAYKTMLDGHMDIPMYIGNQRVTTSKKHNIHPPHDHKKVIGEYSEGDASHVTAAIDAALEAKEAWAGLPWEDRAAIFLRAADLLAGPFRSRMNAATMLAQSNNI